MIPLLKLLSRLPLSLLYILSFKLYILMYYLIGYRKKVVLENLKNAFPEKSEKELLALAKKFYSRFADFIVETLKSLTISEEEMKKRVHFKNPELLTQYAENQQSALVLVSHQFNWEWALQYCSLVLPVQVDGLYKKLENEKMEVLLKDTRSRFGAHMIEKENSLIKIMKRRAIPKILAINADQLPVQSSPAEKYWDKFLNQDTAFFVGGDRIAKMLKVPVYFMNIKSPKRGYYEIELQELAQPPYQKEGFEIMEKYVKATEKLVIEEPEGWLWSHRRWKYKKSVYA